MLALFEPGSIFATEFRIVRPLSQGGMGAVYVVEQLSTATHRALKVMHPQLVADPRLRERFLQEARIGARIESDHVVQVVAAGVDAQSGTPWLAMELLKGETLLEFANRQGSLSIEQVREIFGQLGHALSSAHEAGIVHRDLKPENLFLATARRSGVQFTIKILDFGIARVVAEHATRQQTAALGTPLWMAPEQAEANRSVSPATDVWAVGLIAFSLLTGRYYWKTATSKESSTVDLIREILTDPLVSASERASALGHRTPLPGGFDAWFARCVARDQHARFSHAREAFARLDEVLAGARGALPAHSGRDALLTGQGRPMTVPVGAPLATVTIRATPTQDALVRTMTGVARARTLPIVAVLVVLACAAVGWWAATRTSPSDAPVTSGQTPAPTDVTESLASTNSEQTLASAPPSDDVGRLFINTRPRSNCVVNGTPRGTTPMTLVLPSGPYSVTCATKEGDQLLKKTVASGVDPGRKTYLSFDLRD